MLKKTVLHDAADGPAHLGRDLLLRMEKPVRYVGNEVNMIRKDPSSVKVRIALAFPDAYEVGMSHLGLKILYAIVNERQDLAAERVFAVWPDMERALREEGVPLLSLESATPLSDFDMVGFSLQYELCATNILQMLDLGGVPLRSQDRGPGDPFVVAGGPGAFNPMPLAPFVDAFALGDGEELILELADVYARWREAGGARLDLLREWKRLKGVYVPSLHATGETVSRRIVADIERAPFPTALVVPYCETVHDRIGIEIGRGCTRGCRFCQAGMLYRPVRERQGSTIIDLAAKALNSTGWEEVALLSLSAGDYSYIVDLIRRMTGRFGEDMVALSLPSLRTETFDAEVAEQIRKVRKTGFTLAPEAGSERLRRVINKGNTEEDLQTAVSAAFKAGWKSVKLYFMIGLPSETDEDLDAVVGLIRKASRWAGGGTIRASLSTFVPKPHTPFQWAGQISTEETRRRQHYIKRFFQQGRTKVKFHDANTSFLEGILARGDERLSRVIESAFKKGARFDGWEDRLKLDAWMQAFEDEGIDPQEYLGPRDLTTVLPWDFIDTGISRDYLVQEWERAFSEQTTGDCRSGDCQGCGVCDFQEIYPRKASPMAAVVGEDRPAAASDVRQGEVRRFRLRYAKRGFAKYLGHFDLVRAFNRAFRRAGMKLDYSKGFHPHPKLRFSLPLSLGVESLAEYLEFDLIDRGHDSDAVLTRLGDCLTEGIGLLECKEMSLNEPLISAKIRKLMYEIRSFGPLLPEEIARKVWNFDASPTFNIVGNRKGRTRERDLKEWIESLEYEGSTLTMTIKVTTSGSVNPLDAASAILGRSRDEVRSMEIVKISAQFEKSSGNGGEGAHE